MSRQPRSFHRIHEGCFCSPANTRSLCRDHLLRNSYRRQKGSDQASSPLRCSAMPCDIQARSRAGTSPKARGLRLSAAPDRFELWRAANRDPVLGRRQCKRRLNSNRLASNKRIPGMGSPTIELSTVDVCIRRRKDFSRWICWATVPRNSARAVRRPRFHCQNLLDYSCRRGLPPPCMMFQNRILRGVIVRHAQRSGCSCCGGPTSSGIGQT